MRRLSAVDLTCKDHYDSYCVRLLPRAPARWTLIADDLALDFANTESGRGFPSHENHLREAAACRPMAQAREGAAGRGRRLDAGCRSPSARPWPRSCSSRRSGCGKRFTTSAPRSVVARSRRRSGLAALSALHARFIARAALAPGLLSCRWRWSVRAAPVEAALGPVALAAVRLFTEGDFHRISECSGHACGWLFYDRSKNNRRRWCEMEVCGNRAKQRRLAARRRGLERPPGLSAHYSSPRQCSPAARRRWRPTRRGSAAWRCRRSCRKTRGNRHSGGKDPTRTGAA